MQKIAVFPGSFDPITIGHYNLVKRALPLFDKIIVAVGINNTKEYLFSLEKRMEWLQLVFSEFPKVEIDQFVGLTASYCESRKADFILRGLRNAADFDYEKTISQVNNVLSHGIETIFLISSPKDSHISSSIVREIIRGQGQVSDFLPPEVDVYRTKAAVSDLKTFK
ncbi:MAG TPA: pantetheine-phosphate adenylyltransferase [Saprospiraceae bacterium]|nr:pantetheine-phosphate adenylyltransferase [Saprospiraceae bacterium]HQW56949.1 pantetheine-phosphate adenylyltransferase [Saprospiraceae bacterium]